MPSASLEIHQTSTPSLQPAVLPQLHHDERERTRAFHVAHFPGQEVPNTDVSQEFKQEEVHTEPESSEELGYYEDGVRRTLTDEQITMFRHSEIQRLLLARRQQREQEEQEIERAQRQKKRNMQQKRRFDDEPVQQQASVDTLMYDDTSALAKDASVTTEKKFLWPKLGP